MNPDTLAENPPVAGAFTGISFRRARRTDLIRLEEIENTCFDYYRLSVRNFNYLMHKGTCDFIVAEVSGVICGYAIILYKENRKSARLYSIAVMPEFRNKGVGKYLIEQAEEVSIGRGNNFLYLEVKSSSQGLISFYKNQGFEKYKVTKNYYGENDDALHLRKSLPIKNQQELASVNFSFTH